MTSSTLSQGACLDNNHTHFILVDDGTINKYGGEISFRASLENCISRKKMEKSCGKNKLKRQLFILLCLLCVNCHALFLKVKTDVDKSLTALNNFSLDKLNEGSQR